ncbi:MAG: anti-sigma factor family protein [Paracoccaceae bacterium]
MTDRTILADEDLIRRLDAFERSAGPAPGAGGRDAASLAEWARQDAALRALYGPVGDEPVPDRLRATVGRARRGAATGGRAALSRGAPGRLAAAIVFLAAGALLGFAAGRLGGPTAEGLGLAQAALATHRTYASEIAHPVEMAVAGSADAGRLAEWFARRLGRPLAPPDLGAEGFRLLGGRVLPAPNGAAAAMLYEDATGRRVTVFIAPQPGRSETSLRLARGEGTEGWWWIDRGLGCAVVGEAPREVLKALAGRAYEALAG